MRKEGEINSIFSVIFSNDFEILIENLIDFLFFFGKNHPFQKRIIIVPDLSIKESIVRALLLHPRLEIAMGVQIVSLEQAVVELSDGYDKPLCPLALSIAIEEFLLKNPHLPGLEEYLAVEEKKKRKRIGALSEELSQLFFSYGIHGAEWLKSWLASPTAEWQKGVWEGVLGKDSPWSYPVQLLSRQTVRYKDFSDKIALLGFSYLPLPYLSFFSSIGAKVFQQSPCVHFWEDFATPKEKIWRKRNWKKVGPEIQEQIEQYESEEHPLLSRWGRLNREILSSLHQFDPIEEESYREIPESHSRLEAVRRSLLTLEPLEPLAPDDSIQIHSVTSKLREIEVLYDGLMTLLQKENGRIGQRDICVLSSDLSSYAPYIEMVFGQGELSFAIEGVELSRVSSLARGFLQLLMLPAQEYAISSLFQLFENPNFLEKHLLTLEELSSLRSWFSYAEIDGGLEGNSRSWEKGIERVFQGFAFPSQLKSVPLAELPLLNRFLVLFFEIQKDLSKTFEKKSAADCLKFSLELMEKYFAFNGQEEPFVIAVLSLRKEVSHLTCLSWDLNAMIRVFQKIAAQKKGRKGNFFNECVMFSQLKTGKAYLKRVIWCLGMDEGSFPRQREESSLEVYPEHRKQFPTVSDEDRSLFLELILNAKDYLIFSYERINSCDRHAQTHSFLIDELEQYVEGIRRCDHPAFPLDLSYFSPESHVKKWNWEDFLAARAYYGTFKSKKTFFNSITSKQSEKIVIDLKSLKAFARHPLQWYCQKILKISLFDEEEDTEFVLSLRKKALLRKSALHLSSEEAIRLAKLREKIPQGIFQQVAVCQFSEEWESLCDSLTSFELTANDLLPLHLKVPFEISCDFGVVQLTGTLPDVSPKGLVFQGRKGIPHLVQSWPLYLVYRCLDPSYSHLLMIKDGSQYNIEIKDPFSQLARYLEYFLAAHEKPSPLMPLWASVVFKQSREEFSKLLNSVNVGKMFEDPYLSYLERRGALAELAEQLDSWKEILNLAFTPLITCKPEKNDETI